MLKNFQAGSPEIIQVYENCLYCYFCWGTNMVLMGPKTPMRQEKGASLKEDI